MAFDEQPFDDIIRYYDETRFDYNVAWINKENQALHFGFYDEHASKHDKALSNTNRVMADLVNIQAGERVLDAGCGKGGSCFWLVKHRNAQTVGITPVKSQIEDGKKTAAALGISEQAKFVQADYCNTPFEAASFDVVWACESVCHANNKIEFYREAFRLLKPGGRLVMTEYLRTQRPVSSAGESRLSNWLNRWMIQDIDTAAEHRSYAEEVGFKNIAIQDVTPAVKVSLRNLYEHAQRWMGLGKVLRFLGVRSKVQHDNHVGSWYQYKALQENDWFYSLIKAEKEK